MTIRKVSQELLTNSTQGSRRNLTGKIKVMEMRKLTMMMTQIVENPNVFVTLNEYMIILCLIEILLINRLEIRIQNNKFKNSPMIIAVHTWKKLQLYLDLNGPWD